MSPDAQHDAQALLDVLPLASYVYELKAGGILAANGAFCKLLGYDLPQLREMLAPQLYAAADREELWKMAHTLPPEGSGSRRLQTSDGRILHATVRYRNSDFMNSSREFVSTRLVVIIASQPEPRPEADSEPALASEQTEHVG